MKNIFLAFLLLLPLASHGSTENNPCIYTYEVVGSYYKIINDIAISTKLVFNGDICADKKDKLHIVGSIIDDNMKETSLQGYWVEDGKNFFAETRSGSYIVGEVVGSFYTTDEEKAMEYLKGVTTVHILSTIKKSKYVHLKRNSRKFNSINKNNRGAVRDYVLRRNISLPEKIDSKTILNTVLIQDGITFDYTLLSKALYEMDFDLFNELVVPSFRKNACESKKTRTFLNKGININYLFRDKNGILATIIKFTKNDCS